MDECALSIRSKQVSKARADVAALREALTLVEQNTADTSVAKSKIMLDNTNDILDCV